MSAMNTAIAIPALKAPLICVTVELNCAIVALMSPLVAGWIGAIVEKADPIAKAIKIQEIKPSTKLSIRVAAKRIPTPWYRSRDPCAGVS